MANLSAEEATKLGDYFEVMATALSDYLLDNLNTLSDVQKTELREKRKALAKQSAEFYDLSSTLVMNEANASLATIGSITTKMESTYKTLTNIQKAIDVAAAVVTLGAAILGKNPGDIVTALEGISGAWKDAS